MGIITKLKDLFNKTKVKSKKLTYNFIEQNVQWLNRINLKYMQDIISNDNKYNYEDLMPKIDKEKNEHYCETLEWALKNYNIKNIALTGVYGSGKSTILKTFETFHKEYKYLNISMANFNNETENKETTEGGTESGKKNTVTACIDNSVIEKGILQQMFYKVKYKSIPSSRFKRIIDYKFKYILFKSLVILAAISLGILIFNPIIFTNLYNNVLYGQKTFKINITITYILGIVIFIIIFKILSPAIKYLSNNFRITKISTKAGDAQLDDSEKSIFNKYIDEILYFFEMNKYDVVVFEDLDRFNNIEIFSKLRELNLLINNSEQINRRVVFIYAIKDEIFSNAENKDDKFHYKNRTKFFDFIIPVVQVVNSANACNLMIDKFKDANLLNIKLDEDFISDISFLINDRRVLNNIFNEYIIYKENLRHIDNQYENELDPTKLLSIIVYKNMYPTDFAKLQDDEGMVYELFKNKYKLIESRVPQLKEECKELKLQIEYEKKECAEKIFELRYIYAKYILDIVNSDNIGINDRSYTYKELSSEQGFNEFLNSNNYKLLANGYYSPIQDAELLNKLNEKKQEYLQREKIVKLKEENVKPNVLENLKRKLDSKHNEINLLTSKPLKNLINDNNKDEIFKYDMSKENLLKFLIREGYIDESYSEYISYFYEGIITPKDNEFIHNVMYEKEMEFGRSLDKPKNIMKKLRNYRFEKKYVLNYNLLDFIIENKSDTEKYENCYELIVKQLSNETEISFSFIDGYTSKQSHVDIFVKSLCSNWPNMWKYIQNHCNLTIEKSNLYLKHILEFGENTDILEMNKDNVFTEYISKLSEFLELLNDESKYEKLKDLLIKLDIKFECLNKGIDDNNKLFEFIVKNNLYVINIHMIELIIETKSSKTLKELSTSNYTTILESSCSNLIEYINNNINKYIENVFLALDSNTKESKEPLIQILKNNAILLESRKHIIQKETIIFPSIDEIKDLDLWSTLIENKKIDISWNNVVEYYEKFNFGDGILEKYLNKKEIYNKLSKFKIQDIQDESVQYDDNLVLFSNQIILNETLTETCFIELVKSIPYKKIPIALEKVKPERIDIIIEHGIIGLTESNYNTLKEHFEWKHLLLLQKNIDEYMENYAKYNLDSKDIITLLDDSVDRDKRLFIINNMNINLLDNNSELIHSIVDFIINNEPSELKDNLLSKLMTINLEDKIKIDILLSQIDFIDEVNTFKLLNLISSEFNNLSQTNTEVIISYSEYNKNLIKKLKSKGYISDFDPKNNSEIIVNTKIS
ncbi:hypothetical protein [Clostridium scatologenes]|uniref:Putative NTPase with transmembrane helices n=1 Tax=Clostridium scatologenes TaxID=1548 RepID=A0A0E3M8R0_CLOSL|nr:hypothetical protein [Clostridium scatologenes]AKA72034.1 putative NTPase with transmembrane helices [Clostridium scatologenes]